MNFFLAVFVALVAFANAQFGGFSSFQPGVGGFPYNMPIALQRDARADTGPVVFPQAPADNGMTSGVIVGASGYGFVPPNDPGARARQLPFY